jgi:hypothetical protein
VEPQDVADRLGLELRRETAPRAKGPVSVEVKFFRKGDPEHTLVARDGSRIPKGPPVAELRERLGGDEGTFQDPFGGRHQVRIPESSRAEGWHAAISFHVDVKRKSP